MEKGAGGGERKKGKEGRMKRMNQSNKVLIPFRLAKPFLLSSLNPNLHKSALRRRFKKTKTFWTIYCERRPYVFLRPSPFFSLFTDGCRYTRICFISFSSYLNGKGFLLSSFSNLFVCILTLFSDVYEIKLGWKVCGRLYRKTRLVRKDFFL